MQMRKDKATQEEELAGFARMMDLTKEQFLVWNVFEQPFFDVGQINACDALIAGGSSDDPEKATILDPNEYPWIANAKKLVRHCFEQSVPTFVSCMGFLVSLEALEGRIILDKEHMEEGYYPTHLTDAARRDPLFRGLPPSFMVISFHKKRADGLPPGCVLLAYSYLCPVHAFQGVGKPFYAFQFHPELDRTDLISKLERYITRYFDDEKSKNVLQHIIDTCPETPESNKLARNFIDFVVLGK